jgi:DNA-binding NarL/FixJ family response regulator
MSLAKVDLSILFVDDEPMIREEFTGFLKLISTKEVYSASDGYKGVEEYKKFSPDIVYTDYNMPDLDGIEMILEIKKINPDVKFCFITGASSLKSIIKEKYKDLAPEAIYSKPLNLMKIISDLEAFEKKFKKE